MSACECGCGQPAPVAVKTGGGYRKGESRRFIQGHHLRLKPLRPIRDRVFAQLLIDPDTGCLNWTGKVNGPGYATAGARRRDGVHLVHRLMYEWFVGPIPEGMEIDHLCRNKRCASPAHLEAVTHRENILRAAALITHCPKGHEYTEANTHLAPSRSGGVSRNCKKCNAASSAAWRARGRVPMTTSPT